MRKTPKLNKDCQHIIDKRQEKCLKKGYHDHCEDIMHNGKLHVVCHDCRTTLGLKCEVYSRVVGYLRPVSQWNRGKKEEFGKRVTYAMGGGE